MLADHSLWSWLGNMVVASMRRPPESSTNFGRATEKGDRRPTGGAAASFRLPYLLGRFFFPRRIALLPFALLVELFAPVPVGVLNLKRVLPSRHRTECLRLRKPRSATTSQSPELGDGLPTSIP